MNEWSCNTLSVGYLLVKMNELLTYYLYILMWCRFVQARLEFWLAAYYHIMFCQGWCDVVIVDLLAKVREGRRRLSPFNKMKWKKGYHTENLTVFYGLQYRRILYSTTHITHKWPRYLFVVKGTILRFHHLYGMRDPYNSVAHSRKTLS